jgi:hypothetical protein
MPKYLPHDVYPEAELEDYGIKDDPLSIACPIYWTNPKPLGRFDFYKALTQ